jgi:hypothetical protein
MAGFSESKYESHAEKVGTDQPELVRTARAVAWRPDPELCIN